MHPVRNGGITQLRHSGEADGVGVTRWKYIESQRFADPKARIVVAADFLYQHGALSELEKEMLDDLAWSTFDRFIDSPRLREVFGVDFREGKVVTRASKERVATAFREVAFRISRGELNSRKNNGVDERLAALRDLPSGVLPPIIDEGDVLEDANETSAVPSVPVAESVRTPRKADPVPRDRLFKKSDFNVTEKRESQVFKELCDLPVSNKPNACAVLLRVFLEMSVLHYLTKAGIGTGGGKGRPYAELDILFERAYLQMQKQEPGLVLPGIDAMLVARTTVLRMRELHSYVHNRHIFPAPADLQAFASELTQFIKKIWP